MTLDLFHQDLHAGTLLAGILVFRSELCEITWVEAHVQLTLAVTLTTCSLTFQQYWYEHVAYAEI